MDSSERLNGTTPPVHDTSTRRRVSITISIRSILLAAAIVVAMLLGTLLITQALGTLIALLLAIIIGEAIRPLMTRLRGHRIPGPVAVLLIYVVGLVVVGALFWLLINPLVSEVNNFTGHLPGYLDELKRQADGLQRQLHAQGALRQLITTLANALALVAQQSVPRLLAVPVNLLTGFFGLIIDTVIVLTMTLFWLMATEQLKPFVVGLFPESSQGQVSQVLTEIGRAFGGYVRGTLIAMLLIGSLTGAGLALLGVPFALLLGILAGFTEILPYLGPWISGTVSVLVALLTVDPAKAIQVAILFVLIQEIEGNVIEPLVMSRAVQISPLVVIVSVLIGIDLLGIIGAILAVPIAAAAQILLVRVLAPAIRKASSSPGSDAEAVATEPATPAEDGAHGYPLAEPDAPPI